jgi:hypothetical protein
MLAEGRPHPVVGNQRLTQLYRHLSPAPVPAPCPSSDPSITARRHQRPLRDLRSQFGPQPLQDGSAALAQSVGFHAVFRLGLRRGGVALLPANAIEDDLDATSRTVTWIDIEAAPDDNPRYDAPGLKTALSRHQLPVPQELVHMADASRKGRRLSLRAINQTLATATAALSEPARRSPEKQGLSSVSCRDATPRCALHCDL